MTEPGNVATMHDALVKIRDMMLIGGFSGKRPAYIVNICDTALSVPARNCDVGTAEEQYERFRNYCYTKKCPSITKDNTFSQIAFMWAQMPYEEKHQMTEGES